MCTLICGYQNQWTAAGSYYYELILGNGYIEVRTGLFLCLLRIQCELLPEKDNLDSV